MLTNFSLREMFAKDSFQIQDFCFAYSYDLRSEYA